MRKNSILLIICLSFLLISKPVHAQVDLNNLDLKDIIGKVMNVKRGFAPKFFLGKTPIQKVYKVAEILGLKKNDQINRLFNTFKTGRMVYKIAVYAGSALALYGVARKIDKAAQKQDYQGALAMALGSASSGLIVKFLTKGASYKAVDLFNGIAVKKIKDIFSLAPASNSLGVGLYVKM
jgi:hypothetical protein